MAGFDNDTVYGTGLDLSGNATVANKLATDGFLYFGNSSGNPAAGLLTSTSDTLFYQGASGAGRIENKRWVTPFVVDASSTEGTRGTYTTITLALAAVSAGDTILLRPGTYEEDITDPGGINFWAQPSGGANGNVIVKGKITQTAAGASTWSNIRFQTNADVIIDQSSGTDLIQTRYDNCQFFFDDADCITLNNPGSNPNFYNCSFRQTGVSFDLFNITDCGDCSFLHCDLTASATTGVSNIASGNVRFRHSRMQPQRFTTSGSGTIQGEHSSFICNTQNLVPITLAGTGATNSFVLCEFESGTAISLTAGSGTTVEVAGCTVRSSNANPIGGAGTVVYSGISHRNTGNGINPTTATPRYVQLGKSRASGQPSFSANVSSAKTNVTGGGTNYAPVIYETEVFDIGSNYDHTTGLFTAPVDGKYVFSFANRYRDLATTMNKIFETLITSNRNYQTQRSNIGALRSGANDYEWMSWTTVIADMDAGDTAQISITIQGGTNVVDVDTVSYFQGYLLG